MVKLPKTDRYTDQKWSYYPEDEVRKVASDFRDRDIPCDAIYLDIDYMDNYKVFTWDKQGFPDPKKLLADLKEQGFKVITIIDPGVSAESDYSVYEEGLKNDYF